jgi:hypothetical protein
VPKRAVAPAPVTSTCEVCADDGQLVRYRGTPESLLVCLACVQLKPHELAVRYGQRLRRAAERPR